MKKKKVRNNGVKQFGTAVGVGHLAGFAGTIAITVSQSIEMKLTKREPSTVPADAVRKTLDIQPTDETEKPKLAQQVHWVYGTGLGLTRGLKCLGKKHDALFVGQWAAPFLLLGVYNKLVKVAGHDKTDKPANEFVEESLG